MSFDKIFDLTARVYFYIYDIPGTLFYAWKTTQGGVLCTVICTRYVCIYTWYIYVFFFFAHLYFPATGQAVGTGVVPSSPRFLSSFFIADRVQQSHCLSIFHRVLLTHALAFSASQFVRKKSPHEFIRACARGDSISRN